ncbi:MAG: TPM domain-containing protein [Terrimicrobiaceae bacterium]|nr:TPM domain-containing protein [Terrimicrobiaceae bacterium]
MKPGDFLYRLDDARVVAAIEAAEQGTSGEIRVFVSGRRLGGDDVVARAADRFNRLGMAKTDERNGVLLYFVPRDRRFAVIGDRGIHEKCGADFWEEIAAGLRERLAREEFTEAVVEAITRAGEALAKHFPRRGDDRDELPNAVGRE